MTVDEAMKKYSNSMGSKTLRRLAQANIAPNEDVLYAYTGFCVKPDGDDECVIVVTQKRVLCCSRKLIAKAINEIPLLNIQGMQIVKGKTWRFYELHIESVTETIIATDVMDPLDRLRIVIQCAIDNYEEFNRPKGTNSEREAAPVTPTTVTQIVAAPSATQELREWKALLDEGVITQEEFDAKKRQLLGL